MIKRLDSSSLESWDNYILKSEQGTFFHLSGWKQLVEKIFSHSTYYLYVEENGKITGVLPLVHVKSLLFGNALVSNAFCVYGGIIADDDATFHKLDKEACRLADELGVDHLEMRNQVQLTPDRPFKDLYVTFRKELDPEEEKNLQAIPRKQRAMVRKGIKAGLTSVVDENIDRFFSAYSESVRNLGTPVLPKKYFQALKDVFKDQCEILTIEHNGKLVSSVMNFYFRDQILPYYGGGTEQARAVKANDFMYWEVMRRAVAKGIKIFDFGRSKIGTGSYKFKRHWGFEPEPLYYEFYLVNSTTLPNINPLNPKYQMFIAAWKRLPLAVSQTIGPWLAKDLA